MAREPRRGYLRRVLTRKLAVLTICLLAATFAARRFTAAGFNLRGTAYGRSHMSGAPVAGAQNAQAEQPPVASSDAKHTITLKFNYDFKKTPACSEKVTKKCVSQFNVYDISGGQRRYKLMSIPVPAGATGDVEGITAATPPRVFESGKHLIAVTAAQADGVESNGNVATVWVEIP
jgi:hypothetical protein